MSIISKMRALITLGEGMSRGISELTVSDDPLSLFADWFESAKRAGLALPEAMTVATANANGLPSARMMLLKDFGSEGFVFYTNYESRKALDLQENPQAALVFHWPALQRQIRVEGRVERISTEESAAYFRTRPRGSCIGAWSSKQSSTLDSRAALEQRFRDYERRFDRGEIPLPPFWGGFRVIPDCVEFWQGRINRLHDRIRYTREGNHWRIERLYP
ncbi:MAG: pyridoxamine 5'-phosphate oxidase [Gemmatimonadota bacterium]|nr:MAG: pyridoxamine 5'-phosphate oxidase [Gemmatimonadota bacterium]